MKALQLLKSTPIILTTLPLPTLIPNHALVKIHYSVIQPSDKLNAKGLFPSTTYPRIPGRDYSGTVIDLSGTEVQKTTWIGKEVFGTSGSQLGFAIDGAHAEYCLIPIEALAEKPGTVSMLQAATVGVPFTTALRCLRRARAGVQDVVLVLGANGSVGSAAVQLAKAMGCKRVLTASRGNSDVPDVNLGSGDDLNAVLESSISELTNGRGVDVVVDTVGSIPLMGATVPQLANSGRYVWIAAPRGGQSTQFTFDIFNAYRKEIDLLGCNGCNLNMAELGADLRLISKWFNEGLLSAKDEDQFDEVSLGDAIENGYNRIDGKQVVIEIA